MKPETQRIAIAQICGWTNIHYEAGYKPPYGNPPGKSIGQALPDYLNDLNAMHEAEKGLSETQWFSYQKELDRIVPYKRHAGNLHATAAQRAEAFLKTLNFWTE